MSNKADAYGLQRALNHKLPAIYLPWSNRPIGAQSTASEITESKRTMSQSESRLTALLQLFQVDLVVLAGWMRIFTAEFVTQFPNRIINLHPALLPDDGMSKTYTTTDGRIIPAFRGLHVVKQSLEAGIKVTGSTVHYVTPEVDAGPVICREEVPIEKGDTEEILHERIKRVEHRLIVEAVRRFTQ